VPGAPGAPATSAEVRVANICGKSYALTAVTRMHPLKTYGLRLVFFLIRVSMLPIPLPKWGVLGRIRQVQLDLTELSFIHFARWVIIERGRFPRVTPDQRPEELTYDYLLFESNFNGDWEKYIDAFSQVVPGGMDNIWRWSVKYPKSRPITPFLRYIRNCQFDTDYYYSAYPGAATNDVRGALLLKEQFDKFVGESAVMTPEQFAAAYQRFTVDIQNCLATTGLPSYPAPPAGRRLDAPRRDRAPRAGIESGVASPPGDMRLPGAVDASAARPASPHSP
jgi:hypothetical protein